MKITVKKVLKVFLCFILAFVLLILGYVAYLFLDYKRLDDKLELTQPPIDKKMSIQTCEPLKIISYNIGFGAYEDDYSFFMDGGEYSRAFSKERLIANMENIESFLKEQNSDFYLVQEVDEDGTRSYHVNERERLEEALAGYDSAFALNWDSSYLFYPFTSPHGKNRAGIMTLSRYRVEQASRVRLPVEDSLMKFVDLDRCYSVSSIPTENGKELLIYNVHLSAYTSDGTIAEEQIKLISNDMKAEYEKGNYIVCGGDFNKDLLGNAGEVFGVSGEEYTWAQPFPNELLFEELSLVVPFDEENPIPSCRNADAPYNDEQFVLTVDGFIVSNNIKVLKTGVYDLEFEYSDHNPVYLEFELLE